jgi:hypothetical protein
MVGGRVMTTVWVVLNETDCGFSEIHGVYANEPAANNQAAKMNADDPNYIEELPSYTVHGCEVQTSVVAALKPMLDPAAFQQLRMEIIARHTREESLKRSQRAEVAARHRTDRKGAA